MDLKIFTVTNIEQTDKNFIINYKNKDSAERKIFAIAKTNLKNSYLLLESKEEEKVFISSPNNIINIEKDYDKFKGSIIVYKTNERDYVKNFLKEKNNNEKDLNSFFDKMIEEAVDLRATDIHIEALRDKTRLRFRIDGVLIEYKYLEKSQLKPLISIVKNLSDMDIVNKRKPQDGRFSRLMNEKNIDFRISSIPTIHGEKIEIRLLYKTGKNFDIEDLALAPQNKKIFERALASKSGMIILNGPTGSGKSTSLYVMINLINDSSINISTVEDPIEYDIDGVNQVQCKNEIGLDFQNILRALLRQDPDVLVIGEIRDNETAEIAVKSALTGHLVLTTLHSKDTISAISRLENLEIERYLISEVLVLVISQRLLRRLCPHCKKIEDRELSQQKLRELNLTSEQLSQFSSKTFYRAEGCPHCFNTGYLGRIPVMELLNIDDEFRSLILLEQSDYNLKKIAREKGLRTILEDALYKADLGIVSLDEIMRQLWT